MNDSKILDDISDLLQEERRLREHVVLPETYRQRLSQLAEQLDQCWDLLRQRRAKREFGEDPASAHLRDVDTVRKYEG